MRREGHPRVAPRFFRTGQDGVTPVYVPGFTPWTQTVSSPYPLATGIEARLIAQALADEVSAGPAARIWVTVGFDQVTDRILANARGKTGRAYFDAVDMAKKAAVVGLGVAAYLVWRSRRRW